MTYRLVATALTGALGVGGAYALPTVGSPSDSPAVQVARAARECISDEDTLTVATAVALAESKGNPRAHNPVPPDDSFGFWQINMIGSLGPDRRSRWSLASNDDLFDPATNARAMCSLSGGGQNWRPWTTFTTGEYLSHFDEARAAARIVLADDRGVQAGNGRGVDDPRSPTDKQPTLGDRVDELYRSVGSSIDGGCERIAAAEAPTLQGLCAAVQRGYYGSQRTGSAATGPGEDSAPTTGGLQPEFARRLDRMIAAAPGDISIFSGYRDPALQAELWQGALVKYGSADAARQWVAPSDGTTCNSNHCRGLAADLTFGDGMEQWAHANAARFGLGFPMSWEPWHVELAEARP